MTTSIDPSVDELLLLQENQYQIPNFIFANIKPIGAERKIGHPTNVPNQSKSSLLATQRLIHPMDMDFVSRDIQENHHSFEMPSSISFNPSRMSNYYPSIEEPVPHQTTNAFESFIYHPLSSSSTTSGSSSTHSSRCASHLLNNYNYPREISASLIQQKLNQTVKTIPSCRLPQSYPTSRFFIPHSSQLYSRNPFLNICQQTPIFTAPFQCTRERFQVNSIGRPILRTNNYNHLSQIHGYKVRR